MDIATKGYAVQHGDDYDCGARSIVKREAYRIAHKMVNEYPEKEIRLGLCATESKFAKHVIHVII